MRIAVFTSFAINYLAKARVLVKTLKEQNSSIDVIAIVCDQFPPSIDATNELFDQIWMVEDYPVNPVQGWIFSHNIMELSTAVKGWGLTRLLDAGYDYVMYLDPDCWILADPAKIIQLLPPDSSVGVVPHTTKPAESDEEIRIVETSSLRHGIYNLGFLLVRNDAGGRKLAEWWAARLDRYCIDDFANGLFTDQRWFDLALGYFDFVKVIRHSGIDVASWNVGQRMLTRNGGGYSVDGDELIFYHFSGVGPKSVHRWVRDKFAPADPLAAELEFQYERLIADCGQAELAAVIPFYDQYSDGVRVPPAHRTLYRSCSDFLRRFPNPYEASLLESFRHEAGDAGPTNAGVTVRADLGDVDARARRLFDAEFYRHQVRAAEFDPDNLWTEYKSVGWNSKVLGNRLFDVNYYRLFVLERERDEYPTPLHHYVAVGGDAGLSPSWIYNDAYYLGTYPDVREAVRSGTLICGFEHFSRDGVNEGRDGCAYFNERSYLNRHPDVALAVTEGRLRSGEAHYIECGQSETRVLR